MPTLTMSWQQREALARRLGVRADDLDADTFVAGVSRLAADVERRFEEVDSEPTGILRLSPSSGAPRTPTAAPPASEKVEPMLDAAVARGAIAMDERPQWRRRYADNPDVIGEILETLPGDDKLAARAFEQDARIRSLGDQLDSYMGIPEEDRVVEYTDRGKTESELLYERLAEMTNESLFR